MKNKLFLIALLLATFTMNAQFTVETHKGDPIVDGGVYSSGALGIAGELPFYVYNTSSAPINMKIEFVSLQNGDADMVQLCFDLCVTGLVVGQSYPGNLTGVTIDPGQHQTATGDHILNNDPGNGTEVLDYVFKFYQVDDAGNEIGTPLTMTYRYDPLLGTEEMNKLDISVYPTVVHDVLRVDTDEILEMQMYDLQGRLVKSTKLAIGQQQIDMSNMASQMYLVRFENEFGEFQTTKLIVE